MAATPTFYGPLSSGETRTFTLREQAPELLDLRRWQLHLCQKRSKAPALAWRKKAHNSHMIFGVA
jgi:hypothetical protein